MKAIRKEAKHSSLIHERIRRANFVPLKSEDIQSFKYYLRLRLSKYLNDKFITLKTIYKGILQKIQLRTQKIDFKAIKDDMSLWSIEALIEGFIINFVVWALLGWEFNWMTMLAWGFAVKQLLSIYWRLKKDGSYEAIPTKNK